MSPLKGELEGKGGVPKVLAQAEDEPLRASARASPLNRVHQDLHQATEVTTEATRPRPMVVATPQATEELQDLPGQATLLQGVLRATEVPGPLPLLSIPPTVPHPTVLPLPTVPRTPAPGSTRHLRAPRVLLTVSRAPDTRELRGLTLLRPPVNMRDPQPPPGHPLYTTDSSLTPRVQPVLAQVLPRKRRLVEPSPAARMGDLRVQSPE